MATTAIARAEHRMDAAEVAANRRRTVDMIRMHRSIGTAKRRRRVPRKQYPKMVELAYATKLAAMIDHGRAAVRELATELGPLLASAKQARGDRMDANEGSRARALVERARQRFADAIHPNQVEALAHEAARRTSDWNRQQFQRQANAALGIDVHLMDKRVPDLIEHHVAENVSLIKSLSSGTFDTIEKMVSRAVTTGMRHEELASDLMERFDITERHARLIARDQVGKLNAAVGRERSRDIGLTRFIWQTVGDERVRDEHDAIDGEEFDYATGAPGEGLPGQPVLCRCGDFPLFEDILGDVEEPTDEEAAPADEEA